MYIAIANLFDFWSSFGEYMPGREQVGYTPPPPRTSGEGQDRGINNTEAQIALTVIMQQQMELQRRINYLSQQYLTEGINEAQRADILVSIDRLFQDLNSWNRCINNIERAANTANANRVVPDDSDRGGGYGSTDDNDASEEERNGDGYNSDDTVS